MVPVRGYLSQDSYNTKDLLKMQIQRTVRHPPSGTKAASSHGDTTKAHVSHLPQDTCLSCSAGPIPERATPVSFSQARSVEDCAASGLFYSQSYLYPKIVTKEPCTCHPSVPGSKREDTKSTSSSRL